MKVIRKFFIYIYQDNYVKSNYEEQERLLLNLRRINFAKSVNHTCLCSSADSLEQEIVSCLLCLAKFHGN